MTGCQEARNAVTILEVCCPRCREVMEVFVKDGAVCTDSVCEICGYQIEEATAQGELKCV